MKTSKQKFCTGLQNGFIALGSGDPSHLTKSFATASMAKPPRHHYSLSFYIHRWWSMSHHNACKVW